MKFISNRSDSKIGVGAQGLFLSLCSASLLFSGCSKLGNLSGSGSSILSPTGPSLNGVSMTGGGGSVFAGSVYTFTGSTPTCTGGVSYAVTNPSTHSVSSILGFPLGKSSSYGLTQSPTCTGTTVSYLFSGTPPPPISATPPANFSPTQANLPAGLQFDSNTGIISGTPISPIFEVNYIYAVGNGASQDGPSGRLLYGTTIGILTPSVNATLASFSPLQVGVVTSGIGQLTSPPSIVLTGTNLAMSISGSFPAGSGVTAGALAPIPEVDFSAQIDSNGNTTNWVAATGAWNISQTSITVSVPKTAVTGPIQLKVPGFSSVVSSQNLTLAPIGVSAIWPSGGVPGGTILVVGTGLGSAPTATFGTTGAQLPLSATQNPLEAPDPGNGPNLFAFNIPNSLSGTLNGFSLTTQSGVTLNIPAAIGGSAVGISGNYFFNFPNPFTLAPGIFFQNGTTQSPSWMEYSTQSNCPGMSSSSKPECFSSTGGMWAISGTTGSANSGQFMFNMDSSLSTTGPVACEFFLDGKQKLTTHNGFMHADITVNLTPGVVHTLLWIVHGSPLPASGICSINSLVIP